MIFNRDVCCSVLQSSVNFPHRTGPGYDNYWLPSWDLDRPRIYGIMSTSSVHRTIRHNFLYETGPVIHPSPDVGTVEVILVPSRFAFLSMLAFTAAVCAISVSVYRFLSYYGILYLAYFQCRL